MKKTAGLLILGLSVFVLLPFAHADTVILKDGRAVQGEIVEQTPYHVLIKVGGDYQKYYQAQVKSIKRDEQFDTEIDYSKFPNLEPELVRAIVQFLELNGTRANVQKELENLLNRIPPSQQERVKEVFDVDEIISNLVPIYAKYFSQEEMEKLILFQESPVGRKMTKVTPQLVEDIFKTNVQYYQSRIGLTPKQ